MYWPIVRFTVTISFLQCFISSPFESKTVENHKPRNEEQRPASGQYERGKKTRAMFETNRLLSMVSNHYRRCPCSCLTLRWYVFFVFFFIIFFVWWCVLIGLVLKSKLVGIFMQLDTMPSRFNSHRCSLYFPSSWFYRKFIEFLHESTWHWFLLNWHVFYLDLVMSGHVWKC